MQINHILVANGVNRTEINHALLNADDPNTAAVEIAQIIRDLSSIGYTNFKMYNVSGSDHKIFAVYRVDRTEPVVHRSVFNQE